jgi:predicted dehydrogenase
VVRIYAWSDRPIGWWPQGTARPEGSDSVPDTLDWNLWLGTAPERPYVDKMYAPFNWRGCFDFGCGALGDMACHILDAPYYGLGLGHATSVVSHAEDSTDDRFPSRQDLILTFKGNQASGGQDIPLYWTDGGVIPHWKATHVPQDLDVTENATIVVGEKGSMLIVHPEGTPRLFVPDQSPMAEGPYREQDITDMLPELPERNHYHHWVDRALGSDEPTACRFEVSGPMTEALCLGALSARFPHRTLLWNGESMKFEDNPEADKYIRRQYRSGFEVENL